MNKIKINGTLLELDDNALNKILEKIAGNTNPSQTEPEEEPSRAERDFNHELEQKMEKRSRTNQTWTRKELEYIRDNWDTHTTQELGQILGRSTQSVYLAHKRYINKDTMPTLHPQRKPRVDRLEQKNPSTEQIRIHHKETTKPVRNEINSNRTWTQAELKYVNDNWYKLPLDVIANNLGRSRQSTQIAYGRYIRQTISFPTPEDIRRRKVDRIEPKPNTPEEPPLPMLIAPATTNRQNKGWTEEELKYLRDNWLNKKRTETLEQAGIKSNKQLSRNHRDIAKTLGRNVNACQLALKRLVPQLGKTEFPKLSETKNEGYKTRNNPKAKERMLFIHRRTKQLTLAGRTYEQAWTQASQEWNWKQNPTRTRETTETAPISQELALEGFTREELLLLKSLANQTINSVSQHVYLQILPDRKESQWTTFTIEVLQKNQELNKLFNTRGLFKLSNGFITYEKN